MANDYRGQTNLPRGIRNNNPGNIRYDGSTNWQGSAGQDGTADAPGFVIFADMGWGARAVGIALTNMINKGADTINTLISAWAPPSENNTAAYIASVSSDTGIDPATQLGTDPDTISSLIRAIANHENGDSVSAQYLADTDIAAGMSLMGNPVVSAVQAAVTYVQVDPLSALGWLAAASVVVYFLTNTMRSRKNR